MTWKTETCKTCDYRHKHNCMKRPPAVFPSDVPLDFYPTVGNNLDTKWENFTHACSEWVLNPDLPDSLSKSSETEVEVT